jgi:enoyl-[acyl-carrier protein] reductase II
VVEALSIPVIAAGGIVDGRGVVAAMAIRAEGVQLGTRFVAVDENSSHLNYKRAILEAEDTDTVITCMRLMPTRSLETAFSTRPLELEQSGASAEDLTDFLGYRLARKVQLEGDLDQGEAFAGSSAGLIKEILPAARVVQHLVEGYGKVIKHIANS